MADSKTFNSSDLIVVFGALHLTGFSDGSYIEITYNNPWWTHKAGADGEVASVRSNRLDANVKFTLLQTSMDNDALMAFLLSDFTANTPLPLLIKDLNGLTLFECAKARIDKVPDTAYSTDPTDREWNIFCPRLIPFVGGNLV